jgi:hypothetical protein
MDSREWGKIGFRSVALHKAPACDIKQMALLKAIKDKIIQQSPYYVMK